jgi:hypothetical protein
VVKIFIIFFKIYSRLQELFAKLKEDELLPENHEKEFFSLQAKRKALCDICLKFAVGVLVFSVFMDLAS